MDAGRDGRLHILHCDPFERAMCVVLAAKEIGSRQTKLGKPRTVGAATHDVVKRFESGGCESLAS